MQGRAHGVHVQSKKSDANVLSTAVTTLATSLAAALQPCDASKNAGSSTPPQSRSTTPVRAAQLKTTYISQIKELHSLVEIGALTSEQYNSQRDSILTLMDELNPKD